MVYLVRTIDSELDELFPHLAAIALEGAKGVGKTETAERRALTLAKLDSGQRRQIVAADPQSVLRGDRPILIDEWQRVPEVWDVIRRQVDRDRTGGQFLLTGSATPTPGATVHSGAGRIVQLRMRPLAVHERALVTPSVGLSGLLTGTRPHVSGSSPLALPDYADEITASGFPGIRGLPARPRRAQLDGYLTRALNRDLPDLGFVARHPQSLRAWLSAYAAATSTSASYNRILDAATPGESDKPARTTVTAYREMLTRLWLLDPLPGWVPSRSAFTRLQQAPKHHLADPALAARLLGATTDTLLTGEGNRIGPQGDTLLGSLFESLAALTVRVLAQAAEATVGHLRTRNGDHEVDLIVQRADRRVVAIEVKLSTTVDDRDVRHLHWLRQQLGDDLLDAVVLTTGQEAYRRSDGIAVVPLALLGP